jgi:hypothetical protein
MHFFASAPDLEDFNYKAKKTPPRSKNTPTKAKKRKGATPQNKKMGIAKGVVSSPYNIWWSVTDVDVLEESTTCDARMKCDRTTFAKIAISWFIYSVLLCAHYVYPLCYSANHHCGYHYDENLGRIVIDTPPNTHKFFY